MIYYNRIQIIKSKYSTLPVVLIENHELEGSNQNCILLVILSLPTENTDVLYSSTSNKPVFFIKFKVWIRRFSIRINAPNEI